MERICKNCNKPLRLHVVLRDGKPPACPIGMTREQLDAEGIEGRYKDQDDYVPSGGPTYR